MGRSEEEKKEKKKRRKRGERNKGKEKGWDIIHE
jgi:hypothetical protein